MKHHEFSPSKLNRFSACPWSYQNCKGWESEENSDSKRGTLLHQAVYDDSVMEQLEDRDREMILTLREEHVTKFLKYPHFFELAVSISGSSGKEISAGIVDFVYLNEEMTIAGMVDWKFGNRPVDDAQYNRQLRAYAAGLFQKFPALRTIYAMVVQPVYGMDNYEKQTEFTREMLPGFIGEIETIENASISATPEQAVINPECRYCNKYACAAFKKRMTENFSLLDIKAETVKDPMVKMTVEFADALLLAKKEIESLMEDRAKDASRVILAAGGSENFKVQPGRITKRTDWKKLCEDHGITEEEITGYTGSKEGEPYLMPKMRKTVKKLKTEQ